MSTILWFYRDLRLNDHPALMEAIKSGEPIIPIFIWSPEEEGAWAPGAASRWWLHRSLESLQKDLEKRGSRLLIRLGPVKETLSEIIKETKASAVYWSRRYEPLLIARDAEIKKDFKEAGIEAESFNANLIFEPWEIRTKEDKPFQVFTPFWKACLQKGVVRLPIPAPEKIPAPKHWPRNEELKALRLNPSIAWDSGFHSWKPGEGGASELLAALKEKLVHYKESRDFPWKDGTSCLSPYLHFGEVGPVRVWHELECLPGSESFLREMIWREFAYHLLFYFPHTTERPLRVNFEKFPWSSNEDHWKRWKKGLTGYPIVDAGMRQLWKSGWMHNRVRMIVASFLVKHLLIPWRDGAEWFWDTLLDADLANNTLGWQWTAGCGADAAPYFRIFNPILQGEKFDANGDYVRQWVPELSRLPSDWIHKPWKTPESVLKKAEVEIGKNYPSPIVDLAAAKSRALAAFQTIRRP